MEKTTIRILIDKDLKEEFQEALKKKKTNQTEFLINKIRKFIKRQSG